MGCSGSSVVNEGKSNSDKNVTKFSSLGTQMTLGGDRHKKQNSSNEIKISQNQLIGSGDTDWKKKYTLVSKIGSGAYGTVYKVMHRDLNQLRAMKVISKQYVLSQDGDQSFLKEIEVLSNLDHPNILKIYEYFVDENKYYILMELCEGGELYEKIIEFQYFSEHDAAKIMKKLFSCIFYLHSKGIVHRDLKPENILLEKEKNDEMKDFTIKLIDFGTSNYFEPSNKLTYKIGTAYYIAPEVINQSYTEKCDIWSLGVIMYVLLSGRPPFEGDDDYAIMKSVKSGKYSLESQEWENTSNEAKDLIRKLLVVDPNKRISAEEAFKHPWIEKFSSKDYTQINTSKLSLDNFRNFGNRMKFQQATIAFLVHQASNSSMMNDMREIFQKFDVNGDGQLTYDELKAGFRQYFKNDEIADNEFDNLIKKIDLDNNNYIEYEEFLRVTVDLDSLINDKNLKVAFDFFDKDKSGTLTQEEIKDVLGVLDPDNPDKENHVINKIINEIDTNGDGKISFEEFKQLMVKITEK